MRKVILAALFAYASTGCVAEEAGFIEAVWSFKHLESGASQGCPVGFDTTAVYAYPVDNLGNRFPGEGFIDLYNCADLGGESDYPLDRYEVYMEITTDDNSAKYADTPSVIVDINRDDATVIQTIIDDGGYFYVDWSLRGETSGTVLDCTAASSSNVDVLVTLNGTGDGVANKIPCSQLGGYTRGLIAGTYTVSIAALDSSDRSVGTVPAITNKTILAPNKITDLGSVMIPISGK